MRPLNQNGQKVNKKADFVKKVDLKKDCVGHYFF